MAIDRAAMEADAASAAGAASLAEGGERSRGGGRRPDPLAGLASAAEELSESDRMVAQAWKHAQSLGTALKEVSEDLALERRRVQVLEQELRWLRSQLAGSEAERQAAIRH